MSIVIYFFHEYKTETHRDSLPYLSKPICLMDFSHMEPENKQKQLCIIYHSLQKT